MPFFSSLKPALIAGFLLSIENVSFFQSNV